MVFRANCLPGNLHLTGYVVVCYNSQMDMLKGVADAIEWVTEFDATPEQVRAAWDRGREQPVGPPDLLPLILLELRLVKSALRQMILSGEFDEYAWEKVMLDEEHREKHWREEMKRLGHWDDRYEG